MTVLMNKLQKIIHLWLFLILLVIAGCSTDFGRTKSVEELIETISVQDTRVAHLATQIEQAELVNTEQWEAIQYLSTQMPLVLRNNTPTSTGHKYTPTPYLDIEYPPDVRTNIREVDLVIDAIFSQDVDKRIEFLRYTETACLNVEGLGGPPKCLPDEPEGTLVKVLPASSGEGFHVQPDQIRETLDFQVRGLFAVYRVPGDAYEAEYWPAGEYGIVFTSEDGGHPHVITVIVADGWIVRLDFNPTWPPFETIMQRSDEFILPPIR